ncbi:serrate RNA effector molecule homolog isoform X2 [Drosophila willistoni]|uniref:serrate RNA effector molecule homolog isoform X2 n=1 Tax=Drosophila willistoni TaxID=7260 RepID=UPI000C26D93D|nr:serrate RNA effector molecule homolog isoform X2 [Drosophila willistoni]
MADSDDEYDRKRRDKFRGERSDSYRTERRDERRPISSSGGARDEWNPFRGSSAAGGGGGGGARHRPDYSDYRSPGGGGPRARYGSPGREMPPAKRMRPDWPDEGMRSNPRFGGYDPYMMQAWNEHYQSLHYSHGGGHMPIARETSGPGIGNDTQTQPAMLTLKQFLDTQDENISDSEVMRKYTEYKTDFKRQQLNEFFVAHKDEEWFKNKYHPEDSVRRSDEQRGFLQRRSSVFVELLENGTIGSVKVDSSQADPLVRVLDMCVIKLEGGTDEDLKILDEKPKEPLVFERKIEPIQTTAALAAATATPKSPKKNENDNGVAVVVSPQKNDLKPVNSDEENWETDKKSDENDKNDNEQGDGDKKGGESSKKQLKKKKKTKKRKRKSSDDDDDESSSSDSESSSSSEEEEDEEELKKKYDVEDGLRTEQKAEQEKDKKEEEAIKAANVEEQPKAEEVQEKIEDEKEKVEEEPKPDVKTEAEAVAEPDAEPKKEEEEKAKEPEDEEKKPETEETSKMETENGESKEETKPTPEPAVESAPAADVIEMETETIDLDKVKDGPQPRALHRTASIFLRNLAPSITKAEIEAICNRSPGYLRVAIADPLVERRWYRRGWITFSRDVNIKEICWSLNNQRLRDCELGAIVNRDLSRRVRPTNGITAHKQVVRSDIKLCAKIAMNLDERFRLWVDEPAPAADGKGETATDATNGSSSGATTYGFNTKNPVLQNITDYLIEEASAEEEELLGLSGDQNDVEGEPIVRDEQLIAVLDRLLLYLRIVHSVDYYNHCEYPYEDEMPNRCGIIHARGPAPMKVTSNDIQEYIKSYEGKLQQFLTKTVLLTDDDIKDLGAKDAETEVEKFVQANTQELAKDKWLCPLSGKKFKGPEFIRKHIFNKHEEKVDEVRKEVQFFNNYLRDPKRPQLPEHPGTTKRPEFEPSRGAGGYRPAMYPPFGGLPYGFAPPMPMGGRGGGRGYQARRPGGFDYRPRSHYRDLDAPQEPY